MADKRLKFIRGRLNEEFSRLQTIYDLTKKITDTNAMLFLTKVQTIPSIRSAFRDLLDEEQNLLMDQTADHVPDFQRMSSFDEMADIACSVARKIEDKISKPSVPSTSKSDIKPETVQAVKIKLPPQSIPSFDGKFENWTRFYQSFKRLVHENADVSNLEKVNYLVSHLEGPAKSILAGIMPSEDNYNRLFETLEKRYEDTRTLASYYLDKLMVFKPLLHESERDLDNFLNNFVEPAMALKEIQLDDFRDFLIVYLATKKLDRGTYREFENVNRDKEIPTFSDLEKFIRKQIKLVARQHKSFSTTTKTNSSIKKTCAFVTQDAVASERSLRQVDSKPSLQCPTCNVTKPHALYRCSNFQTMSPQNRFDIVKKCRLCYNCFGRHYTRNCRSKDVCRYCSKRHHSMLHLETNGNSSKNNASTVPSNLFETPSSSKAVTLEQVSPSEKLSTEQTVACASSLPSSSMVLLSTAQIEVLDSSGRPQIVRALLDSGSQSHFITKECSRRLGIQVRPVKSLVNCLNGKSAAVREIATFTFSSLWYPSIKFNIDAFVLENITGDLPSMPITLENLPHLTNLKLADEKFHSPGPIDILLSASLWPKIVGTRKVTGPVGTPAAFDTSLGWIILGEYRTEYSHRAPKSFLSLVDPSIDKLLERFWTLEEVPSHAISTPDDMACEKHFVDNVHRNENGSFTVALPFKMTPSLLGNSLGMCTRRFLSQERRLLQNKGHYQQYAQVMSNHIANGYISRVPKDKIDVASAYYVPHHGVFKPGSVSTPLRIVWDMSAASSSGHSLNDLVYTGPKLQNDIFNILLNFRIYAIAMSADVRQMFLRIFVRPEDTQYQRLLWRCSVQEDISVWKMNTLAFGLSSSPFLAQRVVKHLVELEGHRFPLAAPVLARDLYMDDIAVSVEKEEEACKLHQELVDIFKAGSFTLAKWCTNSQRVLNSIPSDLRLEENVNFDASSATKILGMCWNPESDSFRFQLKTVESTDTKRSILSVIARIFDPLGLLAPLIVVAKIIMKTLWTLKIDWDETIPTQIIRQWNHFIDELSVLTEFSIPRHGGIFSELNTIIVGFADASKLAYGAVVYLCTTHPANKNTVVRLLCAKSCIAPSKVQTIPRLELCAALLLSKLLHSVIDTYSSRHVFDKIVACSDSTVALQWLSSSPSRWKPFIANRVRQLQENLEPSVWYHVAGDTNPADCLSRGLGAKALVKHPLWFNGPHWLQNDFNDWPLTHASEFSGNAPVEEFKEVSMKVTANPEWLLAPLLDRVSSLRRLHRTTAWVLRFCRITTVRVGSLQASEIRQAEHMWLQHIQRQHFTGIFEQLTDVPKRKRKGSKIDPFVNRLDIFIHENILRVGGRLPNSHVGFDQQHPVLLPKNDRYIDLLIDQYHRDNLHTGAHLLMSLLRERYWILSARSVIRKRVHACNVCFRARPKAASPKMSALPSCRLQQSKAFTHCGVDYAGPFNISLSRGRGRKTQKAYLCIFVCMSTKAVHLELASELSTACFLAAFRRFISRRGPCSVMYSDQGTNFIGARSWLKELYNLTNSSHYSRELVDELTQNQIEWKLNPPSAPHFGGLWEANVRCVKTYLSRIIGTQILTFEEMTTVLAQIEALLNSRPLCVLSNDPQAPSALTPAHFLTLGSTLNQLPSTEVVNTPLNRLDHYTRVDWIVQHYWRRWSQEYLHTLQQRMKWQDSIPPLKVGNIVVLMKENTAPLHWPLAIVEEVYPARDGVVRVAKVRTSAGSLIRPVIKLCALPSQ